MTEHLIDDEVINNMGYVINLVVYASLGVTIMLNSNSAKPQPRWT
jgi:hypothetical protein